MKQYLYIVISFLLISCNARAQSPIELLEKFRSSDENTQNIILKLFTESVFYLKAGEGKCDPKIGMLLVRFSSAIQVAEQKNLGISNRAQMILNSFLASEKKKIQSCDEIQAEISTRDTVYQEIVGGKYFQLYQKDDLTADEIEKIVDLIYINTVFMKNIDYLYDIKESISIRNQYLKKEKDLMRFVDSNVSRKLSYLSNIKEEKFLIQRIYVKYDIAFIEQELKNRKIKNFIDFEFDKYIKN